MDPHEAHSSSLSFELQIMKAKNIDTNFAGALFVRCYLPTGNKTRVRLDTQEITLIPSKPSSNTNTITTWNQTFSLDCRGDQESIKRLKQEAIVFELRQRITAPTLISRLIDPGSKLIGRAEIPWGEVHDTPVEKWLVMMPQGSFDGRSRVHDVDHDHDGITKPLALQIAVKVQEFEKVIVRKGVNVDKRSCGCTDGTNGYFNSCVDYEFFAIEAALEAM